MEQLKLLLWNCRGNLSTNARNKTEETIKRIGTQLTLLTETNYNGFNHQKTMFNFERIDHGSVKGTGIAIENRDTRKGHISINYKDDDAGDFNNNHDCNSSFGIELRKIIDQNMLLDTGIEENTPTFPRSMKRLDRIYCHPTLLNQNSKLVVYTTQYSISQITFPSPSQYKPTEKQQQQYQLN
ncbi:hypothetical protein ACTFIU_006202 [Dictyostelium citrinum]